jgi:hypothetical protein
MPRTLALLRHAVKGHPFYTQAPGEGAEAGGLT